MCVCVCLCKRERKRASGCAFERMIGADPLHYLVLLVLFAPSGVHPSHTQTLDAAQATLGRDERFFAAQQKAEMSTRVCVYVCVCFCVECLSFGEKGNGLTRGRWDRQKHRRKRAQDKRHTNVYIPIYRMFKQTNTRRHIYISASEN